MSIQQLKTSTRHQPWW